MLTLRSEHRCFGGTLNFWSHASTTCQGPMRFAVFTPPTVEPVPVVYFLAGLTCTEENFVVKAGAMAWAAEYGLMLVAPDTSPRGCQIPGEDTDWDFGSGAGFYVDATQDPWAKHYQMYSYVTQELPTLIETYFLAQPGKRAISGHSMGGHGALVCALRNPGRYQSVSAFAPISHPSVVPWGQKAFANYLGPDQSIWAKYDATQLIKHKQFAGEILIDQGSADPYLSSQLRVEDFAVACQAVGQPLKLRYQEGYDHGYYFISTFIRDHLQHHQRILYGLS